MDFHGKLASTRTAYCGVALVKTAACIRWAVIRKREQYQAQEDCD